MGKKKGRTGKAAWRKIDTQDVDEYLEKSTREERQGLAFEGVPDADLFFVDKGPEAGAEPEAAAGAPAAAGGKAGKKLTRAQAILQAAHNAKPVSAAPPRKRKAPAAAAVGAQAKGLAAQQPGGGKGGGGGGVPEPFDLWGEEPAAPAPALPAGLAGPSGGGAGVLAALERLDAGGGGRGAAGGAKRPRLERRGGGGARSARAREAPLPAVPAVEVDLPGCSYNPDREQHQDAVALAVAAEMQKVYKKDLEPVAPPLLVDYQPESDELALLQGGEEEEEEDEEEEQGSDAEAAAGAGGGAARRQKALERKSRQDRNRAKRRRDEEAGLAERRRLKDQRRELDRLKQIEGELEEELKEKEEARLRKQLDKAERLASEPPKLGKQRFEPAPLQVLTTDEVTGSLRRLKPTSMLAKDRFKSLQKRGVIEPRKRVAKKAGRRVLYEQGARWEREREGQEAINDARKALKKQKKKGAAAAAGAK